MRISFERTVRTASSEQWLAYASGDEDEPIASIDMHIMPNDTVQATMVLSGPLDEEGIDKLIKDFDDDVVNMADLEKGNLFITIFRGEQLGHFQITETK